ncbi:putative aliphatic sulfonates transport permease protein SsuC [Clostridiales bacterium]|nr:putative aliphatic sulfonates transport permease protein SsuC [Clostridiales bacterium]
MKNKGILVILFWLAVWQTIYIIIGNDVLFASPMDTAKALCSLLSDSGFYKTVVCSFFRIAVGFLAGTVLGMLLGVATGLCHSAYLLLKPAIDLIKAAPVASFIILALAWLKTGMVPIFIASLTVVPVVWSNITEGIASVDYRLLEMAKVYEFSNQQKIETIYLPSVMPYFRSAAVTGAGFAFKSGVAAEVIGSPAFSIGRRLYESKIYLDTDELFAWTAVIIIISVLFERAVIKIFERSSYEADKYNKSL